MRQPQSVGKLATLDPLLQIADNLFPMHERRAKPMLRIKALAMLLGMALFAGHAAAETRKLEEPAVTVHFDYYPENLAEIRRLEHRLEKAIKRAKAGELGETEFHLDGNDGYLYLYGPDADRLYQAARPILKSSRLMMNADITKEYGSRTETFPIRGAR